MVTPEHVRQLLSKHGQSVSQPESDWAGSIPLPDTLRSFYAAVGPVDVTIEGYGNPTFFPRLSQLWAHQAGYRWHGQTGEAISDWDPDWLVVADEGADPFILSISQSHILRAQHGAGTWDAEEIYPDLLTMAGCVAALGEIVIEAGDTFTDDQCYVRPEHISAAVSRLSSLLGSRGAAEVVVSHAGWA